MLEKFSTRILICGILPPPNFGHSMLYQALLESRFAKEFDVDFFNMKFWSYEQHKKVTFAKLIKFIQYYFQFVWCLLTRRSPYVLYAISFDKMPFLKDFVFCMTAVLFRRQVVLHDMGQYLGELYQFSSPFYQGLIRLMMKRMKGSIVLGEATRKVYVGLMDLDCVFAVPAAVADSRAMISESRHRSSNKQTKVLFFSFLQKSKGVWVALHAMPKVIAQNPDVHFTFAGPAESDAFVQEMNDFVKENQLENHFEYAGYVGDEILRTRYFRENDIFIFPTLRDVFGLVLLHAMAESLPVIASREGAIPEIVDDGQTGLLFAKGDDAALAKDILSLCADSSRRKAMGAEGRKKYERLYTLEAYAQRMIKVFKNFRTSIP